MTNYSLAADRGPVKAREKFNRNGWTEFLGSTIFNHMVKCSHEHLDATFGALSDPTRRAILARLAEGEAQVSELAEPFGISLPAVSKHLKVLERAQLVRRHKDGRIHRFTVNPEPITEAMSWIEKYQRFWEQQLDALGTFLDSCNAKEKQHGTGSGKPE